ncbi:hypothetical protein HUU53_04360 [Candidatus Micrarchaeota archaeon]|nr:hypothetical protein [Candidatus Micrarchaeota archaeon]
MIIGLVDCITNKMDAHAILDPLVQQTDFSIQVFTCPEPFKAPVAVKKAFDSGVDVVMVYAETSEEQKEAVDLMHEKILDLEISSGKYAYYALLFDEEWRVEHQMRAIAEKRLQQTLQEIMESTHGIKREQTEEVPPVESEAQEFIQTETPHGRPLF